MRPLVPALVTVWTGLIWVALLVEGRRVAAAVVEATGEEGLGIGAGKVCHRLRPVSQPGCGGQPGRHLFLLGLGLQR